MDAAGNAQSPLVVSAVVDTVAPTVWLRDPPRAYSATAMTVTACRNDSHGGPLSLWLDGGVGGSVVASAGVVCVDAAVPDDGQHTVVAGAADVAGNVSLTFVLDRRAPECGYVRVPPPLTANATVTLDVSASDDLSLPVAVFESTTDGVSPTSRARTMRVFSLADGVHTWRLRCVDAAGNAAATVTVSTTVDTVAPDVTMTESPPRFVNTSTVSLCVSAVDTHAVTLRADVAAADGSGGVATVSVSSSSSRVTCWRVDVSADGNYTATVSATDSAGNDASPWRWWFVVDRARPSHSSGVAGDCVVGSSAVVCADAAVSVSCASGSTAASQAPCRIHAAAVLLRVASDTTACGDSSGGGGSSGGSGGVAVLSGANASSAVVWEVLPRSTTLYTPSLPADGMYAVFVRAVDDAGNVGDVTNVTLWRDATPPSAPPVLVRTPDAVTQSTDALFEVRSGDVTSPGQASLWYQLVSNGVPATPSLVAVPVLPATPSSVVSLSLSSLATDTSHLVRFVSRDQLGRTSSGETLFS